MNQIIFSALLLLLFTGRPAGAAACLSGITRVAGTGSQGYSGDGGLALNAQMMLPSSLVKDSAGNLYYSDYLGHVIRKVDVAGNITVVAGTPLTSGNSGDGGLAGAALLNRPAGMAFDSSGYLYFTDGFNSRVRKISPSGVISHVAGSVTGSSGSLGAGDGGPAAAAYLLGPSGLSFDSTGSLFISEYSAGDIRKVDTFGTITTYAGGGASIMADGLNALVVDLKNPVGMTRNLAGELVFVSAGDNSIWRIDGSGLIWKVAGIGGSGAYSGDGGPALSAQLNAPQEIVSDGLGSFYFTDENNGRIRFIDSFGNITTVAGGGGSLADGAPAMTALLNFPTGMMQDSVGNIYVAEGQGYRIRKLQCAVAMPTATATAVYVPSVKPGTSFSYPSPLPQGVTPFCVYSMREPGDVEIRVWNSAGDLVAQVFDTGRPAGSNRSSLRMNYFAPGVYYFRVSMRYLSGSSESLSAQKFAVLP